MGTRLRPGMVGMTFKRPPAITKDKRTLRRIASNVASMAQLDAMLQGVDGEQRKAILAEMKPWLRFRLGEEAVESGH